MDKTATLEQIETIGIVPVVRASSAEEAMKAIDAIREGGINILEITMTVPGAIEVIREVSQRYGSDVVTGAGTVLDPETARKCIDAGAVFVVSPALNVDTIAACIEAGVPVMPGALSPTEVVTAWNAGADMVKIFPAGAVGGPTYLKNLKGPLPHIRMIPTGGVSLATAADFIKAGAAALGVGTDLVDVKAIRDGNAHIVTERAREFVRIVRETRNSMTAAA
ncbi:MAG TPA: bifunctional 4-hydroxy-2-oxoglutarate aldolase/2-dehydro-3-deoxy-phosphogluconate aldolase [Pyrinomonadaceae bacterium]|jgi:2-dehydro-3-deoxyphosphogluconate aldolase/(4S)-4-hydroxy-2-oxoglutarate aldolase|nr:bifunctional 4-hydroxy-2-oxoglutarate aldolase/2-dehydro-3-deoxy-phosphogluconate aldolase [Pyrinomonadaceae bacterium]